MFFYSSILSIFFRDFDHFTAQNAVISPNFKGNCVFPQNFQTMKSGEITVFYAVFYVSGNDG